MLLGIFVAHLDKYVYICFQVLCILLTKAISCLMHIGFAKKHIYMFSLRKNYRLIPLLLPLIISCSGSNKEQRDIVAELAGKEIVIPGELGFQVGNIPVDYDFDAADFKIVTYVDSAGCTNCRMKLKDWEKVIDGFKSSPDVDVSFLMIVDSDKREEIERIVKDNDFHHPVSIDSAGLFRKANPLPSKPEHQTFLLDADNKVIALGNPVYNPKIRELYARLIFDSTDGEKTLGDVEEQICRKPVRSIGVVSKGDTINKRFRFNNDTKSDLTLQEITPSCHCVSTKVDWKVLKSGEYADVEISYVADTISQQFYRYADIWFKERQNPERLVLHGFIK